MQPRRPDSAKSRITQKTIDTQLNQSKFSQTFTSYTTFQSQKKDQFLKYLEQKDKDPKFKKYQQTNLPQIQQKPKQQLSKINSKPFQKRTSKIQSKPKIQQRNLLKNQQQPNNQLLQQSNSKWTVLQKQKNTLRKQTTQSELKKERNQDQQINRQLKQQEINKQIKQNEMNSTSKSFAEKNKQKMSMINAGMKKIQVQDKRVERKIQLKGFKVNQPGKKENNNNKGMHINDSNGFQQQEANEFIITNIQSLTQKLSQQRKQSQPQSQKTKQLKQSVVKNRRPEQSVKSKHSLFIDRQQKQKSRQQHERQQQLLQISQFINEVQTKNIDYYPQGYDEFVQQNQSSFFQQQNNITDENNMEVMLEKININDFLVQPTENDYLKVQRRIKQNQQKLLKQQQRQSSQNSNNIMKQSDNIMESSQLSTYFITNQNNNMNSTSRMTNKSSIDLDKIIDGSNTSRLTGYNYQQLVQQQSDKQQEQSGLFLSSISSQHLRQRNLFLTQILKGRVTKQQIDKLEQLDKSQLKMHKLQHNKEQDQDLQMMEINMIKKQSNRILQRNIIQASGQIYRDCDYLSQQNKQRLQKLLNGQLDQSPFQATQWEQFAIKRIDQGIRLYRQFTNNNTQQPVMPPQQLLPKDPMLRKQAQRKILKQKLNSVNLRLQQLQNMTITKTKIQQLIKQYQHLAPSQMTQSLIQQRNKQINQIQEKNKLAVIMLTKAQQQKQQIQQTLKSMQEEFREYENECKQYEKLTVQQIINKQKQQLHQQKTIIQQLQQDLNDIQQGTQLTINKFHSQIQTQIDILKQIQNLSHDNTSINERMIQLATNMTIEQLDQMFSNKLKENSNNMNTNMESQLIRDEEKQNEQP